MKPRAPLPIVAAFLTGVMLSPFSLGAGTAHAEPGTPPCTAQTESQTTPADPILRPTETASTTAADAGAAEPDVPPASPAARARFSEIFPDPAGADELNEFIEIENPDGAEADYSGWKIEGNGGKTYVIGVRVGPKAKYAFSYAETKIALVNSGMMLTLRDPAGDAVDMLTYAGPAKSGKSYAHAPDGTWQWTATATPGSENAFDAPAPTSVAATTAAEQPAAATEPAAAIPSVSPAPPPFPDDAARNVSIVEIMPDPVGDDAAEWIALANDGATDASLDGWKLDDAAGGSIPYPLNDVRIPAGGRTRITRATSKLALNNDGDAVRLLGPDDAPRQTVTYANAPEGKTFSLIAGTWRWLPETPAALDVVGSAVPADAATTSAAGGPATVAKTPADESPVDASVTDISPDDDSLMDVEGVVTLAPGVVGKRTFAMRDLAGLGGVFVRAYGSLPLPRLIPGDRIRVVGRASAGAAGFSTTGAHVRKTGKSVVTAEERTIDEIGTDEDGAFVRVTGTVSHRNRAALTLTDGSAGKEIRVRIPARSTFPLSAVAGAVIAAKGVVRAKPDGIELILSGTDAVAVLPAIGPERRGDDPAASRESAGIVTVPEPKKPLVFAYVAKKTAPGIAVGGGIAVLVLAAAAIAAIMRRRKAEELDRLAIDR